jgi:hypothetical protein
MEQTFDRRAFIAKAFVGGLVGAAGIGSLPLIAESAVDVHIGINLPVPPRLVPVPSSPVLYAPSVRANFFQYGGQYYVYDNGGWYVGRGYNGPWVVVAPEYVPRPVLAVPVRYYRRPPSDWRGYRRDAPPRWSNNWGRRWDAEHGRGVRWDRHDRDDRDRRDDNRR